MKLKDYWKQVFIGTTRGINKVESEAIGMGWPPKKGWLKIYGNMEMTADLLDVFKHAALARAAKSHPPKDQE